MNDLKEKIQLRYESESKHDTNLSCGSNLGYLDLKYGNKILDLGCGRGMETLEIAKWVGAEGEAVGLDITPKMIETAQKNKEVNGILNASFVLGDIENLPFENNSFNAVTSNCVINHARDKYRVYKEIYRVLKNGGSFIISDAVSKYPLPDSIKNDPNQWAACFGGAVTEQEYMHSIKQAGFDNIEIIKRREYLKNGYDFISLTIKAQK
jgi:ubiquinone/menaquinone biosynthesis C-methylase UbiE